MENTQVLTTVDGNEVEVKESIFTKAGRALKSGAEKVKESKAAKVVVGIALVAGGAIAGAAITAKANKSDDDDFVVYDLDNPDEAEALVDAFVEDMAE